MSETPTLAVLRLGAAFALALATEVGCLAAGLGWLGVGLSAVAVYAFMLTAADVIGGLR